MTGPAEPAATHFVPRMIATDIDGTMLRSDGSLSTRVRTALHEAKEAGIHVVPATGRPEMVATDVIDSLGIDGSAGVTGDQFWVFANGALTRNRTNGALVRGFWMSPVVAQGLVVVMRNAFPGARFAIELENGMAYEPGFEQIVPVRPDIDPTPDILDGFPRQTTVGHRVQKVLVFDPERTIDELYEAVSETLGDHGVPSYSGLRFIEVSARQVTKALALDALCGDLGIEPAEVAAFGDNHNDVAMLAWAGQGFAMANATDDAKDAADQIIESNREDGLARKIEQFLSRL